VRLEEPHHWEPFVRCVIIFTDKTVLEVDCRRDLIRPQFIVFEQDAVVLCEPAPVTPTPPNAIRIGPLPIRALRRFPVSRVAQVVYDYEPSQSLPERTE